MIIDTVIQKAIKKLLNTRGAATRLAKEIDVVDSTISKWQSTIGALIEDEYWDKLYKHLEPYLPAKELKYWPKSKLEDGFALYDSLHSEYYAEYKSKKELQEAIDLHLNWAKKLYKENSEQYKEAVYSTKYFGKMKKLGQLDDMELQLIMHIRELSSSGQQAIWSLTIQLDRILKDSGKDKSFKLDVHITPSERDEDDVEIDTRIVKDDVFGSLDSQNTPESK